MNIGDEYDVTRLSSLRQVLNKELASQDVRVSLTAFLIKAMSIAMDEYPIINSKFNTATQNSVRRHLTAYEGAFSAAGRLVLQIGAAFLKVLPSLRRRYLLAVLVVTYFPLSHTAA